MGYCGGFDAPGRANRGPGYGFYGRQGRGVRGGRWGGYGSGSGGGGRGWRHQYHATGLPRWARQGTPPAWASDDAWNPPSRENEVEALKDEAAWLKGQLDAINERMDQLN